MAKGRILKDVTTVSNPVTVTKFAIGPKGTLCVYMQGSNRPYPTSLYADEWKALLAVVPQIEKALATGKVGNKAQKAQEGPSAVALTI